MTADPRTLDNESLAKLLDDEARFRPVYNGAMAPAMREAARRLKTAFAPRWDNRGRPTHRHYKGGLYEVMGEALHTETSERMVIYRDGGGGVFVRPWEMFYGNTEDGPERFTRLPLSLDDRETSASPDRCQHCQRAGTPPDCPFDVCPAGVEF